MKQAFCALTLGSVVWTTSSFADPGRVATVLCYPRPNSQYSVVNAQDKAVGIRVTRTAAGTYLISAGGSPWGLGGYGPICQSRCS
jgi:hypothetical protein